MQGKAEKHVCIHIRDIFSRGENREKAVQKKWRKYIVFDIHLDLEETTKESSQIN
jgi:hypothetical protein